MEIYNGGQISDSLLEQIQKIGDEAHKRINGQKMNYFQYEKEDFFLIGKEFWSLVRRTGPNSMKVAWLMGHMTLKEVHQFHDWLKQFGTVRWYAMLSEHSIRLFGALEKRGKVRILDRVKYPGSKYTDIDWEFVT